MCIRKVIAFTDFMSFYNKYKPLTPYGHAHKEMMPFYTRAMELDEIHHLTDKLIDFIGKKEMQVLKMEHHLSRIDRLNPFDKETYDCVDLHLIKKFLIHFKAIDALLDEDTKKHCRLVFDLSETLNLLSPDKDNSESFHLSSAFNDELKSARTELIATEAALTAIQRNVHQQINKQYSLELNGRDFILVDRSRQELLDARLLSCEFYDTQRMKILPVYGKDYLEILIKKEELLIKEAQIEKAILKHLSIHIHKVKHRLKSGISAIQQLDTSLAKARLAIRYKLSKPDFTHSSISIKNGVYYPLYEKCRDKGLDYTPLNANFKSNANLLSGSNMGGKTVLFKTVAFLQLLTQLGFRTPAEAYHTRLFSGIHILGTPNNRNIEGLSSFGQEVHQLSTALRAGQSPLLLVDELAKTTNATEAKAILYAALKYVVSKPLISGFFSTHFINMPKIKGVGKYRMKGLNHKDLGNYCMTKTYDMEERIRLINAFMEYEVIEDKTGERSKDAIAIAQLLGLQAEIINDANDYLERK
ncbi:MULTISPECIES: MutS-related protein [unclassified Carboxylicivirga]|uniref:lysine 5,6-aminomutase reactivase ATPase KamC n=1 Tax=Carboxylicivirga TaxID=1628153 RepID=UPI003D341514